MQPLYRIVLFLLIWLGVACARPTAYVTPATGANRLPTPTPMPTPTLAPAPVSLSAGDPYIPELGSAAFDVLRYTLRLALDPAQPVVSGIATLELQNSGRAGLQAMALDLVGFDVTQVTLNGAVASWQRQGDKLIVSSPAVLPPGATATVVIHYAGEPTRRPSPYNHLADFLGLHFSQGQRIFSVNQPDGARYWFPCNDHPRDKALFRFELVVPPGLMAIANGKLKAMQVLPEGALFVWEHSSPMAPYLAMVVVGDYEVWEQTTPSGRLLRHYVWPDVLAEFQAAAATLPEAVDWMSARLGSFPFESFGFVTTPLPYLSVETQTMVSLSEGDIREPMLVHELAHMWFGDSVSLNSWSEMWRNEGLATYMEALWSARDAPAALVERMAAMQADVDERGGYPLGQIPSERLLKFENYYRGALFVHGMRQTMGDDAFFSGLRLYLTRFADRSASDIEFRAAMEEAAGNSLEAVWAAGFAR